MSYVLTKDFVACVMAQSIPSVPIPKGIGHFVLWKLQMLQEGAGRSYKDPTVGLENRAKKKAKTSEAPHTNRP